MMAYPSMSYWDVYKLPIAFRKWLIGRYNQHIESQEPDPDGTPSPEKRQKMLAKVQQVLGKKSPISPDLSRPIR